MTVVVKMIVIIIVPVLLEGVHKLPLVSPAGNQVVTKYYRGEINWKII